MARFLPWVSVVVLAAAPVWAGQEDLIAQIVAGGSNEAEDFRHSVEVRDCTMTTYRWKMHEGEWVLWSSFEFAMSEAEFGRVTPREGDVEHFIFLPEGNPEEDYGTSMVFFNMKAPEVARFEKSNHREKKPGRPWRVSPRNDGQTHYYVDSKSFFVRHQGEGVRAKAKLFTENYLRYVQEYCTFIG